MLFCNEVFSIELFSFVKYNHNHFHRNFLIFSITYRRHTQSCVHDGMYVFSYKKSTRVKKQKKQNQFTILQIVQVFVPIE